MTALVHRTGAPVLLEVCESSGNAWGATEDSARLQDFEGMMGQPQGVDPVAALNHLCANAEMSRVFPDPISVSPLVALAADEATLALEAELATFNGGVFAMLPPPPPPEEEEEEEDQITDADLGTDTDAETSIPASPLVADDANGRLYLHPGAGPEDVDRMGDALGTLVSRFRNYVRDWCPEDPPLEDRHPFKDICVVGQGFSQAEEALIVAFQMRIGEIERVQDNFHMLPEVRLIMPTLSIDLDYYTAMLARAAGGGC